MRVNLEYIDTNRTSDRIKSFYLLFKIVCQYCGDRGNHALTLFPQLEKLTKFHFGCVGCKTICFSVEMSTTNIDLHHPDLSRSVAYIDDWTVTKK